MAYKDPEVAKAYHRAYYLRVGKFRDTRKKQRPRIAYAKAWRDAHPDSVYAHRRKSYTKHADKRRAEARQRHRSTYVRTVTGQPGSIRYEAKLAGFRSGFERIVDYHLKSLNVKYSYETMKIPYRLELNYIPDFYFPDHDFYVEVKGFLDYDDRRKHLAVQKQHPDLDIRFCFMAADKKMPKTKTTHAQWATKHGFQWCDREIPEEWFNEHK